jgi:hypothetical protein
MRPPGSGAAILISPARGSTRPSVTASHALGVEAPCAEDPCGLAVCPAPRCTVDPAAGCNSSARDRGAESTVVKATTDVRTPANKK